MPTHHVPKLHERPDVMVLVAGEWRPGELRMWTQADDGSWTAQVQWQPPEGSRRIDTFDAGGVRPDETDYGAGR